MSSDWRCDECGPVPPMHVPPHINAEVMEHAVAEVHRLQGADRGSADASSPPVLHTEAVPVWCPWPLPSGWTVTGVAWVGDERHGVAAAATALSGPAPLHDGPADALIVAESPGLGLASRFARLPQRDPGSLLANAMAEQPAHAKMRIDGHPTPLWSVPSDPQCSTYVGEARGIWVVAVAWPDDAGYLLAEDLVLEDLTERLPGELVYGAVSARLHGGEPDGR